MSSKDVPYYAEWAENITHRPDPNRVPAQSGLDAIVQDPVYSSHYPAAGYNLDGVEPSYYDIPMLKAPVWGWEIASYFYLGGISTGCYLIGRAAGERHKELSKAAAYVALLTLLPCPALLIHDLGDPKRFHHMLRIWKPSSPMNLGTWAIMGYSGVVGIDALRHYLSGQASAGKQTRMVRWFGLLNTAPFRQLETLTGSALALIVASYTGVLLSCTANPLWCRNLWLSPLFVGSAVSSGAEALSLAVDLTSDSSESTEALQTALQRIDSVAHTAEAVALHQFLREAGDKAATLKTGKQASVQRFATVATVACEVLKLLPVSAKYRKPVRMAASVCGLAAAFALRWSLVKGGHDAANDPRTSRLVSKPRAKGGV